MISRVGVWLVALAVLAGPRLATASGPEDAHQGKDGAQVVDGPAQSRTFNVGANGTLKLSNVAGDIKVTSGGSEIRVDAAVHAKGRTDAEARAQLNTVKVDMRQTGSRVEVETTHERHSRAWVDYTVTVPAGTSVELRSVAGDIVVSEVRGASRAETVSGDVVANGLSQVSDLRTVSGDVTANNLASDGTINFASVSGDVIVRGLKAKSASFETVSGDARVEGCECGGAKSSSVSGDVAYAGTLVKGGRYSFNAHSGDITLTTSSGFELDAATFSGDIRAEGLSLQGETDRHGPGRTRRGIVGGGGALVEAKTFSGSFRLVRR